MWSRDWSNAVKYISCARALEGSRYPAQLFSNSHDRESPTPCFVCPVSLDRSLVRPSTLHGVLLLFLSCMIVLVECSSYHDPFKNVKQICVTKSFHCDILILFPAHFAMFPRHTDTASTFFFKSNHSYFIPSFLTTTKIMYIRHTYLTTHFILRS